MKNGATSTLDRRKTLKMTQFNTGEDTPAELLPAVVLLGSPVSALSMSANPLREMLEILETCSGPGTIPIT